MSERDIHDSTIPPDAPAEMPLPRLPRPPFWMLSIALISIVGTWIPLTLAARGRATRFNEPRIQILQDMGVQPKLREQQSSVIFADGRAMRPAVPGTVARGHIDEDDHYYRGFHFVHDDAAKTDKAVFFRGFPAQVKITPELLDRGQKRFNIYCSACHGADGSGRGPVNERASEMQNNGVDGMSWTQAADLRAPNVVAEEEGNFFNTITNGIRNMPSYANQVPVEDRWAIIAYLRALQLSQNAPKTILTESQVKALEEAQ